MQKLYAQLMSMADEDYKRFQCPLIPTVSPERVIGVRVPLLRKLAKSLTESQKQALLSSVPHTYYEGMMLHAFVIESITDFASCVEALDVFLPTVDNWAVCDSLRPRVFKTHREALLEKCEEWIVSPHTYVVRFAIEMLMLHGLEDAFEPSVLTRVAAVQSDEYYVKMMVAWFFATVLSKRFSDTVWVLEQRLLPVWTHNKAIQKATESRVVTDEQKRYLRTLKV